MAWARVDDQWFASQKVVPLTLGARGLWVTVLSWSCAQKSPFVPGHMVGFLAGDPNVHAETNELVDARLWHTQGHDCDRCDDPPAGGWVIHDWSEYQDKSLSEKRAEAGAKGGKRSGESRRPKQTDEATAKQTKQTTEANDEAGARPGPSRPVPTQDQDRADVPSAPDSELVGISDQFEQFWQSYPRHAKNGKAGGGGDRQSTFKTWRNLSQRKRDLALVAVGNYRAWCESPEGEWPKHAKTWLNAAGWEQWQQPANVRQLGARASPDSWIADVWADEEGTG